ncbi:MAG: polysaccharide deacetylase family protein [Hyphomicrobiaceae bacterium]
MNAWHDLHMELEAWRAARRVVTFWWRDDDAVAPTPALERMIGLTERFGVPLLLAVIPEPSSEALRRRVDGSPWVFVAQHGLRHRNNAAEGERASEFPHARTLSENVTDMTEGLKLLAGFPHLVPVFVPPWNRIDARLFPALASIGHRGVSTFGPRAMSEPLPGFTQSNCHADIIAWKTTRGFRGVGRVLDDIVEHLKARRLGVADAAEPTGLLTHHLAHDPASWSFLDDLFGFMSQEPGIAWLAPQAVFGLTAPAVARG